MALILEKSPSGVAGLDELTRGGLPQGRATLVCGGPGCGKTLLATGFLVHGAVKLDEPGVLISFDEPIEDMEVNSSSLGFDLADLQKRNVLATDYVYLERSDIEETGAFDLEGLFIRIDLAVRRVGAKRIVLDTIDALFAGLPNEAIVRSEFRRLLLRLKEHGLTTVITAERGEKSLSRHGIEEYISDCVILLDHRVKDEISTRRLRIVKYRGTTHGSNEYPFLIGEDGISVLPVTSLGLEHEASSERVSTGIAGLDGMLEGQGYFRGSSVMVSGGPGNGKTSLAAHLVESACARGETCIYYSFEESPQQLMRNMQSIGIDLRPAIEDGLLLCRSARPTDQGLETHLAAMHREIREQKPAVVVIDPISALVAAGEMGQVRVMLLRLVDHLKVIGATTLFLNFQPNPDLLQTDFDVSSLMDTWILLRMPSEKSSGTRTLQIIKSRGMAHRLQPEPMEITGKGVQVGRGASSERQTGRRTA